MSEILYADAVEAHRAGRTAAAVELLERAMAAEPGARLRAEIQHVRARIEMWHEAPLRAHERLITEAAAVEQIAPRLAVTMLIEAARAAVMAGEAHMATATAARGRELAGRTRPRVPAIVYAFDLVHSESDVESERRARAALVNVGEDDSGDQLQTYFDSAVLLLYLEDYSGARALLERTIDGARGRTRHPVLPVALDTLGALEFRTGRWAAADGHSAEALRLARELDQTWQVASCLTTLARIAAVRGREHACRKLVAEARELVPQRHLVAAYAASALALLELGLGRPEAAMDELEPLHSGIVDLPTIPTVVQWLPDFVEAAVRAQHTVLAEVATASFEDQAASSRRTWAIATAARCRGLIAQRERFADDFRHALAEHEGMPTPFERARTELCFGERLRRARRHAEAATHLQSAFATFERLGAIPWASRARRELESRSRSTRRRKETLAELLTAHELQVAALVGRGATNREAASALFVSPKTIEYHLRNIYRKLDVRSRTELATVILLSGDASASGN